jgi:hypothetical protein
LQQDKGVSHGSEVVTDEGDGTVLGRLADMHGGG